MEILNIGSTPYDEPCAQVGRTDYNRLSIIECRAFANQCHRMLESQYGPEYTVVVRIKSFPHDFGSYKEVVVEYTPGTNDDQALWLESADIANWDDEAKEYLQSCGYTLHLES
jgi:hypothetical protein